MAKKSLLLFIVLLPLFSFGQKYYGGALVGFNGSQLDGDGFRGYNKLGLLAGTWMQTDINETWFWGAELKYSQKGSCKYPNYKKFDYEKFTYRLNYVDLPVLFGYRYNPSVSFIGGLSFNYLTGKSASSTSVSTIEGFDYINNWEMGMLMGLKVDFDKVLQREWAEKFILDFRFNYSVISLYKENELFVHYRRGLFNNSISTALYYRFGKDKRY